MKQNDKLGSNIKFFFTQYIFVRRQVNEVPHLLIKESHLVAYPIFYFDVPKFFYYLFC